MDLIVVGVDGSDGSRAALRWAAAEAKLRDARLEVAMAWHYRAVGSIPIDVAPPETLDRAAQATVSEMLATEGLTESDRLHIVTACGPSAPTLLTLAKDADLLVVGSRGFGAFAGMLLGSVSRHVTEHAGCPVAIIPTGR